jgi:hypothetical protein
MTRANHPGGRGKSTISHLLLMRVHAGALVIVTLREVVAK